MATAPPISPPAMGWAPPPESIYRLTVDQYEAMVDRGLLTKRDRLHLIDGILVAKMTKKPPHVTACEKTRDALQGIFRAGWRVMVEAPVHISAYSEPEPDVALARGSVDDYRDHHPGPADVPLIVEVADSSLSEDREMVRIYGEAGVATYWIVNLVDRQLEVYSDPCPGGYRSCQILAPGEDLRVVIDGIEMGRVAVSDLLS
jgi:Uma2 family endonuclease